MKDLTKRNEAIKAEYLKGKTPEAIGQKYSLTRSRIQQILTGLAVPKHGPHRTLYTHKCRECGKDFTSPKITRIYCSRLCQGLASRKYKSEEEKKAYQAIRANNYYHQVLKRRPNYKEIIKERNARAQAKRNEEKGKK